MASLSNGNGMSNGNGSVAAPPLTTLAVFDQPVKRNGLTPALNDVSATNGTKERVQSVSLMEQM